jgi:hypothetical protein
MNKALEDLQAGRDPFAASRNEIHIAQEPSRPFCYRAARLAVWMPIIGGLLIYGGNNALEGVTGTVGLLGRLALVAVFILVELGSLVMGVIALSGVREYGPEGLLWRGLRSVVGSLIVMGLFTSAVVSVVRLGIENRRTLLAMRATAVRARTDAQENTTEKPEEKPAPAAPAQPQPAAPVPLVPDPSLVAAPAATPDDAVVSKATSAYLQKILGLTTNYTSAVRALEDPPILNMSTVARREQLIAKKELVKKFLAINEKLEAFVANSDDVYRKELQLAHCTPEKVEATVDAYRRSSQEKNLLALKIRGADQRKGDAMLGIIEVLDSSWGQWKYDQETKRVLFTDGGALRNYLTYREAMDSAVSDQKRLQALVTPLASL